MPAVVTKTCQPSGTYPNFPDPPPPPSHPHPSPRAISVTYNPDLQVFSYFLRKDYLLSLFKIEKLKDNKFLFVLTIKLNCPLYTSAVNITQVWHRV